MKSLNIVLLLEKKQMLSTRLSKFSSKFPRLEGFGLITCVSIHLHMCALTSRV